MSLIACEQYFCDHHKCVFIVLAMRKYRETYGEACPMENVFFSDHQVPPCCAPRPEKVFPGKGNS